MNDLLEDHCMAYSTHNGPNRQEPRILSCEWQKFITQCNHTEQSNALDTFVSNTKNLTIVLNTKGSECKIIRMPVICFELSSIIASNPMIS